MNWIKTSERLPEKQGHYLVHVKNSFPKNCRCVVSEFYEDNKVFYSESSENPLYDVTHWMEIEEPREE